MSKLWYFETVGMTGSWGPCTSPYRPETVLHGGHEREKRSSGIGPRIRRITAVPLDLQDLGPAQLRKAFWGDEDTIAVAPARLEAAGWIT